MDEHNTLFIERIKNDLIEIVEAGTTEPQTTWALIDNALTQLILIKDKEITSTIQEYFKEQTNIKKEIKNHQDTQEKLAKKYADNVKNMYEEIKKL